MRFYCIGDIRGKTTWTKIIDNNELSLKSENSKVIITGDYFEQEENSKKSIYELFDNYLNLVGYKKYLNNNIILLIGDNDLQYIYSGYYTNTFNNELYKLVNRTLREHVREGILQIAHVYDDFLFSHAGFTEEWCKNSGVNREDINDEALQEIFKKNPSLFTFIYKDKDTKINCKNIYQSPLRIHYDTLLEDSLNDYTQIVGHTKQNSVRMNKKSMCVDTLDINQYLMININKELQSKSFITRIF